MLGALVRLLVPEPVNKARVRCLPNHDAQSELASLPTALHAIEGNILGAGHPATAESVTWRTREHCWCLQARSWPVFNAHCSTFAKSPQLCVLNLQFVHLLMHWSNSAAQPGRSDSWMGSFTIATLLGLCLQRDQPLFCLGHLGHLLRVPGLPPETAVPWTLPLVPSAHSCGLRPRIVRTTSHEL